MDLVVKNYAKALVHVLVRSAKGMRGEGNQRRLGQVCTLRMLLALCVVSCGCITIPNATEVRSGIVFAQGHPSMRGDTLGYLQIDLRSANADYRHDIWAATKDGKSVALADITIGLLKSQGAREWIGSSHEYGGTVCYDILNSHYWFDGERLIAIRAWEETGFRGPRFGSRSSGSAITLPCTLREFESVFGKSEYRERYFHW